MSKDNPSERFRKAFADATGATLAEEQVLLIGANPLPPVLAALAMRPEKGVWLVFSDGVDEEQGRVERMLTENKIEVKRSHKVGDALDMHGIKKELHDLDIPWAEVGLSYTGGTKAMAIAAHQVWSEHNKCEDKLAHASYLGSDGKLRFDGGRSIPLHDYVRLTMSELFQIHFGRAPKTAGDLHKKKSAEALSARDAFLKDKTRLEIEGGNHGKKYVWMEIWPATFFEQAKDEQGEPLFDEVHQDVRVNDKQGEAFQADVLAVRGYTAYLFSCTASHTSQAVKDKLFEAVVCSAELGGDLARAAVVSLSSNPENAMRLMRMGASEDRSIAASNFRSFGLDHVRDEALFLRDLNEWVRS